MLPLLSPQLLFLVSPSIFSLGMKESNIHVVGDEDAVAETSSWLPPSTAGCYHESDEKDLQEENNLGPKEVTVERMESLDWS